MVNLTSLVTYMRYDTEFATHNWVYCTVILNIIVTFKDIC